MQSGWTAGPDGVREPRPHHSSGIDVPMKRQASLGCVGSTDCAITRHYWSIGEESAILDRFGPLIDWARVAHPVDNLQAPEIEERRGQDVNRVYLCRSQGVNSAAEFLRAPGLEPDRFDVEVARGTRELRAG